MVYATIYLQGSSRVFNTVKIPATDYVLTARLSLSKKENKNWIIFVHGNRKTGQSHPLYIRLLNNLNPDISILALDLRGFGESPAQGLAKADNIINRSPDIDAAVRYLEETYSVMDSNIILMGHSLGSITVLKASQGHNFRHIIPIGPSDFSTFLTNPKNQLNYISKFKRTTGIKISSEQFVKEASLLTPQALFTPCPTSPITLVFGANDLPHTFIREQDSIPIECRKQLNWLVIPFSNHMYQTEDRNILQPIRYRISVSLLALDINKLLNDL